MDAKLLTLLILCLLIGTGIGYSVSFSQISMLQSETSSLESEVSALTTDYNNLNSTYNQLKDDYSSLNSSYNELLAQYNMLQSNYSSLNSTYSQLREAYKLLNITHNQLTINYTNLDASYKNLNRSYNELQGAYEEASVRMAELEQVINYEVYVLADEEYYQALISDLKNANETILLAMYSMIYDPDDSFDWANDLIRELVYADERGVNISVVIEYRTYWDYMDQNLEAYNYLLAHNLNVQLDSETSTDHMKLVIIDGKIVYVGSHNWSESALYYNHETSVKIVSEDIAAIFTEYLKATFDI